ncbi:MAG: hypothetical protein OHK0015_05170 [Chloroflexi bacterium OHK40]|jgi:hypothetical protein
MRSVRLLSGLLLVLTLLGALAACGGEPVTLADLPVHPDASPLEPGSNPMADTVADSIRQSFGQGAVSVDMQLYTLPAETSWERVQAFYEEQISAIGGDWEAEPQLAQDTPALKTIGWSRGAFAGEQGLVISYGPPLLGNPPFLLVALVSEGS